MMLMTVAMSAMSMVASPFTSPLGVGLLVTTVYYVFEISL